jgi:hypothetical protein
VSLKECVRGGKKREGKRGVEGLGEAPPAAARLATGTHLKLEKRLDLVLWARPHNVHLVAKHYYRDLRKLLVVQQLV